jgi:hypothetical protein
MPLKSLEGPKGISIDRGSRKSKSRFWCLALPHGTMEDYAAIFNRLHEFTGRSGSPLLNWRCCSDFLKPDRQLFTPWYLRINQSIQKTALKITSDKKDCFCPRKLNL